MKKSKSNANRNEVLCTPQVSKETRQRAYGHLVIEVIRNGQVVDRVEQGNLLMFAFLDASSGHYMGAYSTTDALPVYDDMNGTYAIASGVLTRSTGTGTFVSGDVGKSVRLGGQYRTVITGFNSSTSVNVDVVYDGSNLPNTVTSVSATSCRRYIDSNTGAHPGTIKNQTLGTTTYTFDLAAGTNTGVTAVTLASAASDYTLGAVQITSAGNQNFATTIGYVKLVAPVSVLTGDQLQMTYTRTLAATTRPFDETVAISDYFTGWPYNYPITAISGNGTTVTATLTVPAGQTSHHFAVGDKITSNVVPIKTAISSASSTSTVLTINTASAHGKSVGESVTHEGCSVAGYNGTFTIDTVPDADTYTIASAANPGAMGASGTTRLATPVTYFNGEFTLTAIGATTVSWSSAVTGPTPEITTSGITSPDRAKLYTYNGKAFGNTGAGSGVQMYNPTQAATMGLPSSVSALNPVATANSHLTSGSSSGYVVGANATPSNGGGGVDGFKRIKRIAGLTQGTTHTDTTWVNRQWILDFETPQPKFSSFSYTSPSTPFWGSYFKDLP